MFIIVFNPLVAVVSPPVVLPMILSLTLWLLCYSTCWAANDIVVIVSDHLPGGSEITRKLYLSIFFQLHTHPCSRLVYLEGVCYVF